MRRHRKQFAVTGDKAAALQREQDAACGGARQVGGAGDVAERHRTGHVAERLQEAQAAIEALDKIGSAFLAAFAFQLWHGPSWFRTVEKL